MLTYSNDMPELMFKNGIILLCSEKGCYFLKAKSQRTIIHQLIQQ
jgi:hypothetical protein